MSPLDRLLELAHTLEWALDLIDLYDRRLEGIDGTKKVYTPGHIWAKEKAREIIAEYLGDRTRTPSIAIGFVEGRDFEKVGAALTPVETEALNLLAQAWGKFLELPVQHTTDQHEFMLAIHAAQRLILYRPAYRALGSYQQEVQDDQEA